jgi:hypothetical protein
MPSRILPLRRTALLLLTLASPLLGCGASDSNTQAIGSDEAGGSAGAAGSGPAGGSTSSPGGSGGFSGSSGQAGEAGSGGSDGCEQKDATALSLVTEGDGTVPALGATQMFALKAEPAVGPGAFTVAWSLIPTGLPDAAGELLKVTGDQAEVTVDFCEANLVATVTFAGCATPAVVSRKITPSNQGTYVSQQVCEASPGAPRCGARLQPWCTIQEAIPTAGVMVGVGGGDTTIRVQENGGQTPYKGPIRLPGGVSLIGGYAPGFPSDGDKNIPLSPGVTFIALPDGNEEVDPIKSDSGVPNVRSVISVGENNTTGGYLALRNVTVQFPVTSPLDKIQGETQRREESLKWLTAGVHVHGRLFSTLEHVTVTAGVALPENTEGVYVSGGDAAEKNTQFQLIDCDLHPSPSQYAYSNGLKIDRAVNAHVQICGGRIRGGGALALDRQSAGVLFWGQGGDLKVTSAQCNGALNAAFPRAEISGGLAYDSYGMMIDPLATSPIELNIEPALIRGLSSDELQEVWPATFAQQADNKLPSIAAVFVNVTQPITVNVDSKGSLDQGPQLVGIDLTDGVPHDHIPYRALVRGLWAGLFPGAQGKQHDGFSISLKRSLLQGFRGQISDVSSLDCDRALGLWADKGNFFGEIKIEGVEPASKLSLAGGTGCTRRTGAALENYSLKLLNSPDSDGLNTPLVIGSSEANSDSQYCYLAEGADLVGYGQGAPAPLKYTGGIFHGGNDCDHRIGISTNGTITCDGVTAIGTTVPGATQATGLMTTGPASEFITLTGESVFHGGVTDNKKDPDGVSATGIWIRGNSGGQISGVDAQGSVPDDDAIAQDGVLAVGLRVDRVRPEAAPTDPLPGQLDVRASSFTGGPIAGSTTGRSVGVRIRGQSYDGNTYTEASFEDAAVTLQYTNQANKPLTILGNSDQTNRPTDTVGLEVQAGGVLSLGHGTLGFLQTKGGFGLSSASGVELCTSTSKNCSDLLLSRIHAIGGSAKKVRGLRAGVIDGLSLLENLLEAEGAAGVTMDSVGLDLTWGSGTITNNYVFGASKSDDNDPNALDIGCALRGEIKEPLTNQMCTFAHNLCVGGGGQLGDAIALRVENNNLADNIQRLIHNNLLYGGSLAARSIGWFESGPKVPGSDRRGNALLRSKGKTKSYYLGADYDFSFGTLDPPGYFCNENDFGCVKIVIGGENSSFEISGFPASQGLTLEEWHPLSSIPNCNFIPLGIASTVTQDFDLQQRSKFSPGPSECTTP